jgi:hypothetical protein
MGKVHGERAHQHFMLSWEEGEGAIKGQQHGSVIPVHVLRMRLLRQQHVDVSETCLTDPRRGRRRRPHL